MIFWILLGSIALLLALIGWAKVNPFIALIVVTLLLGLGVGMSPADLLKSVQLGIGQTLGGLVLVLGFGVMLGSLLVESGAAQRIAEQLVGWFGRQRLPYAMLLTGFVVGASMFYNAGFVMLIPLVFVVAAQAQVSRILVGLATATALSVTHGFLPPHPGPVAIAKLFGADLGLTLLYSMCLAVPILVIAGIIFPSFVKHIPTNPPEGLLQSRSLARSELPSFGLSIGMALLPVGLMASSTVATLLLPPSHMARIWLNFLGEPSIALLLALGMALIFAGILKGKKMTDLMKTCTQSVESITMILMIIGAGGAFKQVLTDSGIGQQIVVWIQPWSVSPLVLGWLVASCIRIAIGSASVAGLTAAGIVQPLVASSGVSAELMVLSIGAGSLMCSHVNDTGFWMFKEYFGLNLRDTFRTWTAMETIVGVLGLAGVLALNTWVV